MKQRTLALLYLLLLVTGIVWAAGDAVTVRSVDNVPTLQLSLDGTKAGGAVNARGDASGNLKVNIAASSGTSNVNLTQVAGSNVATAAAGIAKIGLTDGSGTAVTVGQTTMAASLPVTFASNQSALPASQSGTWTVQPGNTANTTPWLSTINQGGNSAVVSAAGNLDVAVNLALPTGANTIGNVNQTAGTSGFTKILDTGGTNVAAVSAANALKVDGSAVTQPVSGTVTANAGTGNFATNLAQVNGSAVSTAATGIQKVGITDSSGTAITLISGNVPVMLGGWSYSHQAAATAGVTIKSGAGVLHTITCNNTGTGDLTTVYDNTAASGTVIAIVGPGTETTFTYDVSFSTGLTVAISSVTTAPDLTFSYR